MTTVQTRAAVLSRDTSREAEDLQVQIWRSMTPAQKLDLALGASKAAREMARAGLRDRHPGASEDEITQRLALITLGDDLARRAYPDIGRLVESHRS
jgi:Rv0078B-related antitoxin